MSKKILKIHPADNVAVALTNLRTGEQFDVDGKRVSLVQDVPAKHKFVIADMNTGDEVRMYGITVGKTLAPIPSGAPITTSNGKHEASSFSGKTETFRWTAPDVSRWKERTYNG